jgi:hypothetical protein
MLKEYARVAGAIYAADFLGPKIANMLVGPEVNDSKSAAMMNTVYVVGSRIGAGLAAYYLLGKVGV